MVPSLVNHGQFALIAASTDARHLSLRGSRGTQPLALRTTLIPTSPTSGIVLRIFVGNVSRKVSASNALNSAWQQGYCPASRSCQQSGWL